MGGREPNTSMMFVKLAFAALYHYNTYYTDATRSEKRLNVKNLCILHG